jgi:hypothetical protein
MPLLCACSMFLSLCLLINFFSLNYHHTTDNLLIPLRIHHNASSLDTIDIVRSHLRHPLVFSNFFFVWCWFYCLLSC